MSRKRYYQHIAVEILVVGYTSNLTKAYEKSYVCLYRITAHQNNLIGCFKFLEINHKNLVNLQILM